MKKLIFALAVTLFAGSAYAHPQGVAKAVEACCDGEHDCCP